MNRTLFHLAAAFILLAGCEQQPTYTDNGNPGAIKATVFFDDNKNGTMDGNETGAPVEIGVSQDISCPPSSLDKNTFSRADTTGVAFIGSLKPGKYCVGLNGNYSNTTRMNLQVFVSSDLITVVAFGIVREP